MNTIEFGSKYAASLWDVAIVDGTKKNKHTCGAYAVNILNQVSKYSMRRNAKSVFTPVLARFIEDIKELEKTVKENELLIEALYRDTAMSREELIVLASQNNIGIWPHSYSAKYPITPSALLFANVFSFFDSQCIAIDALIRTGWLESSKGTQLHKRLAKPIRSYMQNSVQIYKESKSNLTVLETSQ